MIKGLQKAYEIKNAKIQYVSLVDAAANKKKFILQKADDGKAAFTTYGRIIKANATNHYVTGVVYEPMTEDSQGNFMTEEEITKAAYYFAKNGNKVDLQHNFEPLDGAAVVETWVAKADYKIDDEAIRKGTWLLTVEVTDTDIWNAIEKGEITGFSMGGIGEYSEEDVNLDNVNKEQKTSEKKGLLKQLAAALGLTVVEKGAVSELYEERKKGTLFWNAINSLEAELYTFDNITGRWSYETNEARVRECLEDFNKIISDILLGGESIAKVLTDGRPAKVEKAGKKMSGKNKETLINIYNSLGEFLKEFDEPEDDKSKITEEDYKVTKEEIEEIVAKSIKAEFAKMKSGENGEGAEINKSGEEINISDKITTIIEEAIAKTLKPQQEPISAEQVQEMITSAVEKAINPLLKSKGLPSNLGNNSAKSAGKEHYLHGIL